MELTKSLERFFNFAGKRVLYVGAGGGQLLSPSSRAKSIIAVDRNAESLNGFRRDTKTKWAGVRVRFSPRRFESVRWHADVVYFEFCLHQMTDPARTLKHAGCLAPEIVVMDHLPESEWMFYAAEEFRARVGLEAMQAFGIERSKKSRIFRTYKNYEEIAAKLLSRGEISASRLLTLKGKENFKVQMEYGLFLLRAPVNECL